MKKTTKNRLWTSVVMVAVLVAVSPYMGNFITEFKRSRASDKEVLTDIYNSRVWGGWKGVGPGSTEEDGAKPFLDYFQKFLDTHPDIKSIVDIGCGYGELLKNIKFPEGVSYLGLDLVESVIEYNKKHYVRDNFEFRSIDKIEDLSSYNGDLLLLKDVLGCWSLGQIAYARKNIFPNFKYAIVVTNIKTSWQSTVNSEIRIGDTRPLNLEIAPFFMNPSEVKDYFLPPHRMKRIYLFVNQ